LGGGIKIFFGYKYRTLYTLEILYKKSEKYFYRYRIGFESIQAENRIRIQKNDAAFTELEFE
jgi:hypothetical protein